MNITLTSRLTLTGNKEELVNIRKDLKSLFKGQTRALVVSTDMSVLTLVGRTAAERQQLEGLAGLAEETLCD